MFNIAILIIPIGFIADTFYIDKFCSDRFRTRYVADRYVLSVHLLNLLTVYGEIRQTLDAKMRQLF